MYLPDIFDVFDIKKTSLVHKEGYQKSAQLFFKRLLIKSCGNSQSRRPRGIASLHQLTLEALLIADRMNLYLTLQHEVTSQSVFNVRVRNRAEALRSVCSTGHSTSRK